MNTLDALYTIKNTECIYHSGKKIHYLEEKRPYRPGEGRFRSAVARKFNKMVTLVQDKLQGKEELLQEELSEVQAEIASLDMHACPLGGIMPPKLTGHFYAMSVYFYAIDCVRHHGHFKKMQHWPSPKLNDIQKAAYSFCASGWDTVSSYERHQYTKPTQLQNRCFESLYISTLLEHGFGIDGNQRMVTLALEVEGIEVEWTLGYALAEL